jgi:hypothetical protein
MINQFVAFAAFVLAYLAAIAVGIYVGYHTHPLVGVAAILVLIAGIHRGMDAALKYRRRQRKRTILVFPQSLVKL